MKREEETHMSLGNTATANQQHPPSMPSNEPEICICAAIKLDDGRVILGHRHDDCIQTALKWKNAGQDIGQIRQDQQGFVTSRNRFVDRTEGADLMRKVGHVTPALWVFRGEVLFSEDLY